MRTELTMFLKTCFYQTAQKKKKRIILASATPTTKKEKTSKIIIPSSSDDTTSDEEPKAPSPSKYIELNTSLSELTPKANELLAIITTSKELVKYVKLVRETSIKRINIFFQ